VLSSELVLVGTLGVVGATVGLNAVSDSINLECVDFARAMRSLDQSYEVRGVEGCGAWTAGSAYHQAPVEESLAELDARIADDLEDQEERRERLRGDDEDRREHDRRDFEPRERMLPERGRPEESRRRLEELRRLEERRRLEEERDSRLNVPETPEPKQVVPPKKKPKSSKADDEVVL
jgi:hypothetical protein